ncbi:hypothetical protein, partial [Escherichia coli]|uniref:hypothetical protein n=1 Tax=Escherichia coli TaxID=562 RepID=UPI001BDBF859
IGTHLQKHFQLFLSFAKKPDVARPVHDLIGMGIRPGYDLSGRFAPIIDHIQKFDPAQKTNCLKNVFDLVFKRGAGRNPYRMR